MKPSTIALALAATKSARPAFSIAVMVLEEIQYQQPKRVRLNKLINLFRLCCDAVLATGDIATATVIYFEDESGRNYQISQEQVGTLFGDCELISTVLESVTTDTPGRVKTSDVIQALAQARLQVVF